MNVQHTLSVHVPLADVARSRASVTSPRAARTLFPIQLCHAPQEIGDGDETDLTVMMWLDPPLWIGFELRKPRNLLQGVGP